MAVVTAAGAVAAAAVAAVAIEFAGHHRPSWRSDGHMPHSFFPLPGGTRRALSTMKPALACPAACPAPTRSGATARRLRRTVGWALLLTTLALPFAGPVGAAPLAPPVRAEIEALLVVLQASACSFQRNGAWYSASEARTHLLRKLDYLAGKEAVASSEQFITLGASRSSISGRPYRVKCADAAPVDSGIWLIEQLQAVRALRPAAASDSR